MTFLPRSDDQIYAFSRNRYSAKALRGILLSTSRFAIKTTTKHIEIGDQAQPGRPTPTRRSAGRCGSRYASAPPCATATPYQARHTYASTLLTAGTNRWYGAQQLGHIDVQMVFRIYGKFIPADCQKPKVGLRMVS